MRPEIRERHAERVAQALLPFHGAGHLRPLRQAHHLGANARPDIDERVAGHQHMGTGHPARDAVLLGAVDEVIDEDAETSIGRGLELIDHRHQLVDAVHRLDDDRQLGQLIAPHVLHQLGVVTTLDPDPTGLGDASAGSARRPRHCW